MTGVVGVGGEGRMRGGRDGGSCGGYDSRTVDDRFPFLLQTRQFIFFSSQICYIRIVRICAAVCSVGVRHQLTSSHLLDPGLFLCYPAKQTCIPIPNQAMH